jgi:hypothetical protein
MKSLIVAISLAAAAAAMVQAQDVKSTTTVKADGGKTVVYTGCLQPAETAQGYILESAVPMKESATQTRVRPSGVVETTTTTSFVLLPADQIDLGSSVGHKVQVTAIQVPRGDDRTTIDSKTTAEVKGQPTQEKEVKEKIPQQEWPQLRVVSVKHLTDSCE